MISYALENEFIKAEILSLGGIIHSLYVKSHAINVIVGKQNISEYLHDPLSMGATISRYAGRVQSYSLNDRPIELATNKGFQLHGDQWG